MTGPGPIILIIEDESPMRRLLRPGLQSFGYRLVEARTAAEGISQAEAYHPDALLVDLGLPDGDGVDLTRRFRGWTQAPIVVLSARGQEADKLAAFDAGADDYLMKPFSVPELLARLRALLRRTARASGSGQVALRFGDITLDPARREVHRGDDPVHLTPHEYRMFTVLAQSAGTVVTYKQLLMDVWGPTCTHQVHYLRVFMTHLRRKLESDPAQPRWLLTVPGIGYRLCDE